MLNISAKLIAFSQKELSSRANLKTFYRLENF